MLERVFDLRDNLSTTLEVIPVRKSSSKLHAGHSDIVAGAQFLCHAQAAIPGGASARLIATQSFDRSPYG